MPRTTTILIAITLSVTSFCSFLAAAEPRSFSARVHDAVERSLPLLEIASAETARRRTCFTCHGQAMPAVVFVEARKRGFHIDHDNLVRQLNHTYSHLKRSQNEYADGRGTGGQVDTAGWALWGLEAGERAADDITDPVVDYILGKQSESGDWPCSSNRPPSEKSNFATTYLALRAIEKFGRPPHQSKIEEATKRAARWFETAEPKDTEDRVFQLLSLPYIDLDDHSKKLTKDLMSQQGADGGWAQLPEMESDAYATATALYALAEAGTAATEDSYGRGLEYLLRTQLDDGLWHVASRSKPFQTYFETGYPHDKDQFISTTAACWATLVLLNALPENSATAIETLSGTKPLQWPESDLSGRLMIGAHKFVESRIAVANEKRYELKIDDIQRTSLRSELLTVLGVVEERLPPQLERFGDEANPALVAECDRFRVFQVRWPVFANVFGEGLWVQQKASAVGRCVVVPDADQSPEQLLGLADGLRPTEQIAKRLAANGFDLIIPTIISRKNMRTDDDQIIRANITDREWIYRQAFHMGRHVIGFDLQRVFAAVDCFANQNEGDEQIGIVGYGEAIDDRIDNTLVSGYFDSSDAAWSEPIYRNVWKRSIRLGNAEVASLIAPRELLIEHSEFSTVTGHKGEIVAPPVDRVQAEFKRIRQSAGGPGPLLILGDNDVPSTRWSDEAFTAFLDRFGAEESATAIDSLDDRRAEAMLRIAQRQKRCTDQAEEHIQTLVRQSEHIRDDFFLYQVHPEWKNRPWSTDKTHDAVADDVFIEAIKGFRERFATEAMGRFDVPLSQPDARTRKVAETDKWTAYDVVLDVHESLYAWGTLLIPKDLKPGERRPVVVCQHGRNGIPRDTIDNGKTAYNDYAAKLAERGFITLAPHNLYRGEDKYRWLDRKANAIGCTLFSFIIASHDQMLRWLDSLPFVDGDRIAFYGLSYGGETAVRVPTALPKYCLSICSGDFNQWTRKVASTDQPFSFMRTIEWEMPYWNLGNTFDYAEMTYLMYPRPFMVERGHHDGVGRDQWVAYEFAKVRWLYAQFGKSDRVGIEFFQGGHSINGQGSFDFLHKHLNWPAPQR
ncbi:MAG: prenyltransferase/squalene oxidase repeat-containing protein [Aureliella sp.]